MSSIMIAKETCTNCSTCAEICPMGIFSDNQEEGLVTVKSEMETLCIHCGHCQAYCPSQAIDVDYPQAKAYTGPVEIETITPEQIRHYLANRRSVRHFTETPVDRPVLEELMEIARYAPTGGNAQQVNWVVIQQREDVRKLAEVTLAWAKKQLETDPDNPKFFFLKYALMLWEQGLDLIYRDAPNLAVAYAPNSALCGPTDAAIATTYLELAAPSFGVGTCWAGFLMIIASASTEVRQELGIPDDHTVNGALMLGYSQHKPLRVPKRNAAKVNWL